MSEQPIWRLLTIVPDERHAHVLAGLLKSNGITVRLEIDPLAMVYGLFSGPLAEVKVFVIEEDFALARQLLAETSTHPDDSREI